MFIFKKKLSAAFPTQNKHFEYSTQSSAEGLFEVKLGPRSRQPQSGFAEAVLCAQEIYESRKGDTLNLCLSGGIDSSCMLEAFHILGLNFNVTFMAFEQDLNLHDIKTNLDLCSFLGIPYRILTLDVLRFFESGRHMDYAHQYRCQSPQIAAHLWMLDQIDGIPLLAGNPFVACEREGSTFFVGLPSDLHCSYFRYLESTQRLGVPWFFIYSPELCSSFLRVPTALKLQTRASAPEDYTYLCKCTSYREAGFSSQPRTDKYTGFERVRDYYDKKLGTQHGVGFDRLFREPMTELNPFPKSSLQLVPREYFSGF